MMEYTIIAVF